MRKLVDSAEVVNETVRVLESGGVVMHPTETCYGFAVDVFNEGALEKLYRLKGRDFNKPLSILVDGFGMANEYGFFSRKAVELARMHWPGPLSIVVPRKTELPDYFNKGEDFVSMRVSGDGFCTEIVKMFGGPITTTSANVSGMDPLYDVDLVQFGERAELIDLVVDGGSISSNNPSTVVRVDGDLVEVLRQGDLVV